MRFIHLFNVSRPFHSMKFNPIQDADGNWIISEEEVDSTIYTKYKFLEGCPKIKFNPKIEEIER